MIRGWHQFVRPHLSQLQAGNAAHIWNEVIAPGLDEFTAHHFETLCRTWTAGNLPRLLDGAGGEVGAIWPTKTVNDAEIDVAAQVRGGWLTGECRWTRGPVDRHDLEQLLQAERRHLPGEPILTRLLFARSGPHAGLRMPENTRVIDLEELFSSDAQSSWARPPLDQQ